MSNRTKKNKENRYHQHVLHLFQCLQGYILKSGNAIPNMYDFCIMGRDHGSVKPWMRVR